MLTAHSILRATLQSTLIISAVGLSAADIKNRELISWDTKKLSPDFLSEGTYHGDFNNDGTVDVVPGAYWYAGPGFSQKHRYQPVKQFDPVNYSDNFLTFVHDFNQDGWDDTLIIGCPGQASPAQDRSHWNRSPQG